MTGLARTPRSGGKQGVTPAQAMPRGTTDTPRRTLAQGADPRIAAADRVADRYGDTLTQKDPQRVRPSWSIKPTGGLIPNGFKVKAKF